MSHPGAPAHLDPDARAELEEEREFLLRSLEDLDAERAAGDLHDADYQALKDDYTARAAEVLRAIEEHRVPVTVTSTPGRRGRRLVAGFVVVAMAATAGLSVASFSGTRQPGETVSGDIRETTSGQLAQAAALVNEGDVTEALRIYDEVLADDPENLEALSERGLLLVSLGFSTRRPALSEQGRVSIERALALDADNARALFYLGLSLRLEGDDARAADAFTAALASDPPPALRQAMEEFLASIASGDPMPAPPAPPAQAGGGE
ncbi:MAG: tetratricopeptide repeat protein [Actinobacteria bacterium]|nr:tetratricopeptide repeat protein [Actinomycetota bacterium]